MTTCQRRTFLKTAGRSGMAAALGSGFAGLMNEVCPARETAEPTERFVAFTESFQAWPIPQVCQRFREMGLDGLDLTVRPGGHIAPEDVQAQLPAAAQAARDHGLRIHMLSTAVVSDDPLAERVLATAAESGIDRIKLGYIPYRTFGKLSSELDAARRTLERIVRLAEKHSVLPCVHVHSGATIPGNGPVAWFLLRDFTPKEIGAYVDPMHMTIEGGNDGWRQSLDLLAPWIAISSLKNAIWLRTGRDEQGQERWRTKKCPLADGIAPIPDYFARLRQLGYRGLYTLHSEYCDANSWKLLSIDECLSQTQADLTYVRGLLAKG